MIAKLNNLSANLSTYLQLTTKEDFIKFSLKLMLLVMLLFMNESDALAIFVPAIVLPGILFEKIAVNKYYWVFLAIITSVPYLILDLVGYVPNHKHIYAYVCIAFALVLLFSDQDKMLTNFQFQSKIIIGLCFLFATIGKFLAPEFMDGSFFEFTNTADPRFFGVTSFTGNVGLESLLENESNMRNLMHTTDPSGSFILNGVDNVSTSGFITSYWTIFIEGMIAITFCLPTRFLLAKFRNLFLMIFVITTYPIATVGGFAILLVTLGFIQSIKDNRLTLYSVFFLIVFCSISLLNIPFTRALNLIFS